MTYLNTEVNILEALDEIKTSFEPRDFSSWPTTGGFLI